MSLELFLDSKIIMSMTKKTHFWPLDETTWTFNDLGEMMAKTKTEQKRKKKKKKKKTKKKKTKKYAARTIHSFMKNFS